MKYLLWLIPVVLIMSACTSQDSDTSNLTTQVKNHHIPIVKYQLSSDSSAVSTNSKIVMTFATDVDETSLTTSSVSLDYTQNEPITLEYTNKVLTISPVSELQRGTNYTITLDSTISFTDGSILDKSHTYTFVTAEDNDTAAPVLKIQYPANGDTNVSTYASVVMEFDEDLNQSNPTVTVSPSIGYSTVIGAQNMLILFNDTLEYNTTYTVTVSNVNDLAIPANSYSSTFSFTTETLESASNYIIAANTTGVVASNYIYTYLEQFNSDVLSYSIYTNNYNSGLDYNSTFSFPAGIVPTAHSYAYSYLLYVIENDTIRFYDYSATLQTRYAPEGAIANIATDESKICIAYESGAAGIYDFSSYNSYDINSSYGYLISGITTASDCIIGGSNALISTATGVAIVDMASGSVLVTVGDSNVTSSATSYNRIIYSSGSVLSLYDTSGDITSPTSQLDLNATIAKIVHSTYDEFLFVSIKDSNMIYGIDVSIMSSPQIKAVITADFIVDDLAIYNSTLIATRSSITDSQAYTSSYDIYDIMNDGGEPIDVYLQNTPYSVSTLHDVYLVSNGSGVEVVEANGTSAFSIVTDGTAVNSAGFEQVDTNQTYVVVADYDAGIKIYKGDRADSGEITTSLVSSITDIGRVFDVAVYSVSGSSKLFVASATKGMYEYNIADPANPILVEHHTQVNSQDFGALYSIEVDIESSAPKLYLADNKNSAVYVYSIATNYAISYSATIDLSPYNPRDLAVASYSSHLFVSMGSAGIYAIDVNNSYAKILKQTPGYAMQIAAFSERAGGSFVYMADYSAISGGYFDTSTGTATLEIETFPAKGAHLSGLAFSYGWEGYPVGLLASSHTSGEASLLIYEPDNSSNTDTNDTDTPTTTVDPIFGVSFETYEVNTTATVTYDPFL